MCISTVNSNKYQYEYKVHISILLNAAQMSHVSHCVMLLCHRMSHLGQSVTTHHCGYLSNHRHQQSHRRYLYHEDLLHHLH